MLLGYWSEFYTSCSHFPYIPGRLVCWDRDTEERRAILPIDARGVSKLVAIGDNLYIGCKSAYFSAKNLDEKSERRSRQDVKDAKSKMYIALTSSFLITEVCILQ